MKTRLKKFKVTVNYSHESAGGYDHNDGDQNYEVLALNYKSAEKKGLKMAKNTGGGYERKVVGVERIK